jgi:hypothetical protein
MIKKIIILVIIALSFTFAQNQSKHYIGLSLSTLGGSGLTYKHFVGNNAIRVSGILFGWENNDNTWDVYHDFGLAIEREFKSSTHSRLYVVVATQHQNLYIEHFAVGVGFGFEVRVFGHLSIYLEAGESYYKEKNNLSGIVPVGSLSIGYLF